MFAQTIDRGAAPGAFDLEGWTVEPQLNRIANGETSIHLEPKAMELLVCLAENQGQVVSRQVLVDRVWRAEFIADTTLTHTIADLRRALADDARTPRFIETIPKRGYRLVAEVRRKESVDPCAGLPSTTRRVPFAVIAGEKVLLNGPPVGDLSEFVLILGDREIPLFAPTVTFGRGNEADIQILVPEVSRYHARLHVEINGVVIEDLGSKNGTQINGEPIESTQKLASGDTITIGPTALVLRSLVNDPTRTQEDS